MEILMTIQTAADTLATQIGTDVGTTLTGLVLAVLGFINKYATDLGKKVLSIFGTLPDLAKPVVALAFGQLVAFVNLQWGVEISPDMTALGTSLFGVAIGLLSSGWHSILKLIKKD